MDENQKLYDPAIVRAIAATDCDGYVGQGFMPKSDPLAGLVQAYDDGCVSQELMPQGDALAGLQQAFDVRNV